MRSSRGHEERTGNSLSLALKLSKLPRPPQGAGEPHHTYPERPTCRYRRHRAASRTILRDIGGVLAQPAEVVRVETGGTRSRRRDRTTGVGGARRATNCVGRTANAGEVGLVGARQVERGAIRQGGYGNRRGISEGDVGDAGRCARRSLASPRDGTLASERGQCGRTGLVHGGGLRPKLRRGAGRVHLRGHIGVQPRRVLARIGARPTVRYCDSICFGGGGGNRTRVRRHGIGSSTCLASSIALAHGRPDGQGADGRASLCFASASEATHRRTRRLLAIP